MTNFIVCGCLVLLVSLSYVNSLGNVGVDLAGKNISTTTTSSAVACASLCDLNVKCKAWSFSTCATPASCTLRSTAESHIVNTCITSSVKLGTVGVDRLPGGEIAGYNPKILPASSTAAACADLCTTVGGCVSWSFDSLGRQNCSLKNIISSGTTVNRGRTSGVQGLIGTNSPYFGINTWILAANETAQKCSDLCFATPKCKVWLYQPPNSACGVYNAGMCWAKTNMFYDGFADQCYTTGQQAVSTAPAVVVQRKTPADIMAGLPNVQFPFSRIVAFGDNLSDNGNGSYAHCAAAPPSCSNSIYGARTWTNGPIAVSYLSTYLKVPLDVDYAYGHAYGGSRFGATIDNNYTNSDALAPSAKDQIANYTSSPDFNLKIAQTLHFLWIGANDINLYHINVDSTNNSVFAQQFSALLVLRIQSLLNAGAQYIFLPNLYPKHIAPVVPYYANTPTRVANLGAAIKQANDAIKASVTQFGGKVIYYDVYSFMLGVWQNSTLYGITHVGGEYCDGYNQLDWELCVTDAQGDTFFWMQMLDMTTWVHNLIAADMYKTIVNSFV